jgi:succinyl-CoA synthetase beta subunit
VDLYEYQGKQYFARFGIPTSAGGVADTVDEAVVQADAAGYPVVVKAQVKVGGRGKAGGVKLAADADEVRLHAGNILGLDIKGHVVKRLWVEHASDIAKEYYASFTLDRPNKLHLGMLSAEGGVEIEEVAVTNPDAIAMLHIDPIDGLTRPPPASGWTGPTSTPRRASRRPRCWCGSTTATSRATATWPRSTRSSSRPRARCTRSTPRSPSTRTPPSATPSGRSTPTTPTSTPREDGQGEGAQLHRPRRLGGHHRQRRRAGHEHARRGDPGRRQAANFLDIGGGANADVMAAALEVINADPAVKSIFVNIFGGITRVDEVAKGIIEAMGRVKLNSPVVMRLDGTNAVEGRALLADHLSDRLIAEPTMLDAARHAVALAQA